MVGNATEEALLKDLKHPSHRDRPVWPLVVALIMLGAAWGVLVLLGPLGLPLVADVALAALVVLPLGVAAGLVIRRYSPGPGPETAEAEMTARQAREEGVASEIAAARASGAFDRWEAKPQGKTSADRPKP